MNCAGQTVLLEFSLIGHEGEVVCERFTSIMDVGDVLTLYLETQVKAFLN